MSGGVGVACLAGGSGERLGRRLLGGLTGGAIAGNSTRSAMTYTRDA
jgi:hypothetical protein